MVVQMAKREATLPVSLSAAARWRIDVWDMDGWRPVARFRNQTDADDMLAALHQREPESLFRVAHLVDADAMAGEGPAPSAPLVDASFSTTARIAPIERAPVAHQRGMQRMGQLAGALGLVALVGLSAAARLAGPGLFEPTSRSTVTITVPDVPKAVADAAPDSAAPAAAGDPAGVPAPLAGRWSVNGSDCSAGEVQFLTDHELRIAADGSQRRLAIQGYLPDAGNMVRVAYAGGATAAYATAFDHLSLVRARVARIDITPQVPLTLERCAVGTSAAAHANPPDPDASITDLPNTPAVAFRLAVRVGDDLAAALALARGMGPNGRLDDGLSRSPLEWVIANGRAVLVSKLVAAGADPDQPNAAGLTPLSQAVKRGDPAVVEALLAAGADLRKQNQDGTRPFDLAVAADQQLLIDILFAAAR